MKGFVSEGANIILQRIMACRQEVPENGVFLALESNLEIASSSYVSNDINLSNFSWRKLDVALDLLNSFKIRRKMLLRCMIIHLDNHLYREKSKVAI